MSKRLWLMTLMAVLLALPVGARPDGDPAREALQKLNEFVGEWKGNGGPDKPRPDPKDPVWKESISWSWKFKGDTAWLAFEIKDGKHLKAGEVKYLADKKHYELTVENAKKEKSVFTGKRDEKGYLTFERVDATSGETQQIVMNTAADGIRFIYRYAIKPKGRTVFAKQYQVAANKEGESMASKAGSKGPECPVTGGLGTIQVSYKGMTYYVCCTGCRDAFNENPEKYVKK